MITDVKEIQTALIDMLKEHIGVLRINHESDVKFEVTGTVEAMQGKKKVDGIYFSSVVPKPKDVRLYFFPTYTHKEELGELPENVKKCLKGKSCFHIKKLDDDLLKNLKTMVSDAIVLYKKDGLL